MMPTAARQAVALAVLSFAALVVVAAPASAAPAPAATAGCAGPVKQLNAQFAAPQRRRQQGPVLRRGDPERASRRAAELYAAALQAHPQCGEDFETARQPSSPRSARSQTAIKGTPFLGPIGWLWNTVYYRVFSGNDVMMGLFGWALLLSPIILVFSIVWVMKGARGALRKPHVPEHLRADL